MIETDSSQHFTPTLPSKTQARSGPRISTDSSPTLWSRDSTLGALDLEKNYFRTMKELRMKLTERKGKIISRLEKTALALDEHQYGAWTILIGGLIYILFRLLIIVLSFTSLGDLGEKHT